jgi:hypothetical protein
MTVTLDLLAPIVPPERFHPAFPKIVDGLRPYDRQVLDQSADGFVDRDGKLLVVPVAVINLPKTS